jgi:hypothetical protein
MKKMMILMLLIFSVILSACQEQGATVEETPEDYMCKDQPLSESCYRPSDDLDFISTDPVEYVISELFDTERVNQSPRNWLLYRNEEYAIDGVKAIITDGVDGNRFVRMFSDGLKKPPHPQSAPTPTFIFTTKFNLDIDRKGIMEGSLMIPSDVPSNPVTLGVSTGAVNTISVTIGSDMKVSVQVGGPYFYYSGTGDGGDVFSTAHTLSKDIWYRFRFEWDASINNVKAYLYVSGNLVQLHSGAFHISNRVNALMSGMILVPNVVRVTMPRNYMNGWAYLDNVVVERKV